MQVCIVVHSNTGNTLSIANALKTALDKTSHQVTIERINALDEKASPQQSIELISIPDLSSYEAVIFAAPVWAFSLSAVMKHYLKHIDKLPLCAIGYFVTMGLPFKCLGGNRAIRIMKSFTKNSMKNELPSHIIHWSKKDKQDYIDYVVNDYVRVFEQLNI